MSIELRPLWLMLMAASVLIYQHGEEKAKGPKGNPETTISDLKEAAAMFGLARLTEGLIPLYGIFKMLHQAGKEPDALSKIQMMVQTAGTLGLGYTGIVLGSAFSEGSVELQARQLHAMLNHETAVTQWLNKFPQIHTPGATFSEGSQEQLAQQVYQTRQKLNELLTVIDKARTPEAQAEKEALIRQLTSQMQDRLGPHPTQEQLIKEMRVDVAKLRGDLLVQLDRVDMQSLVGREGELVRLHQLLKSIEQPISRMIRALNPLSTYILMTTVVSVPLIRKVNTWIAKRYPQLKQQQIHFLEPLPPRRQAAHSVSGGHGTQTSTEGHEPDFSNLTSKLVMNA